MSKFTFYVHKNSWTGE